MKIVAADPGSYIDKFNFRSEICISCDWRRLELGPKVRTRCRLGSSLTNEFLPDLFTRPSAAIIRSRSHALAASWVSHRNQL